MMFRRLVLWAIIALVGHVAMGQQRCATHLFSAAYNDSVNQSLLNYECELNKQTNAFSRTQQDILHIPVVVHIIHDGEPVGIGANISNQQVLSQITVLNEDFRRKISTPGYNTHPDGADAGIEFVLAGTDPNGLPTNGINRINGNRKSWNISQRKQLADLSSWPPSQYLNIWVCNLNVFLGYAEFPYSTLIPGLSQKPADTTIDGFVVNYKYFGRPAANIEGYNYGRTSTHELGHFLGLIHPWGDKTDCTGDDFCDDTPISASENYGCNKNENSCPDKSGLDLVENYLTYADDPCMNVFTNDQVNRMRTVLLNSPRRKSLTTSIGLVNGIRSFELAHAQISPNPCGSYGASIDFDEMVWFPVVEIYSVDMRLISVQRPSPAKKLDIQTHMLPNGMFWVRVISENFSVVHKLIKSH